MARQPGIDASLLRVSGGATGSGTSTGRVNYNDNSSANQHLSVPSTPATPFSRGYTPSLEGRLQATSPDTVVLDAGNVLLGCSLLCDAL